ncbi:MAG: arginine deiminase family protein, partial [Thermoanaerobaculia bacterium]
MPLHVTSEVGRLRRVLIHRPGREIDWMVPAMMERLLFDDILYSERARHEHDGFRDVLRAAGVETLDPEELLAEALAGEAVRTRLLARMEKRRTPDDVLRELDAMEPAAMATTLITGICAPEPAPDRFHGSFYRLPPVPNYFFQRDPQIVVGDRVVVSSMATTARAREPLLALTVFESHSALGGLHPPIRLDGGSPALTPARHLEGGDVLVAAPEVLMVGLSERTNRRGIEALARQLHQAEAGFRHLIVVEVPAKRSYMHLDTVFTFIDRDLCLAYLPV